MKKLIQGATIVSPNSVQQGDILIDGEKITAVGNCEGQAYDELVSAEGLIAFPGFIDAHTHFDLDVCNTTTADDFSSGTLSALCGGTTTVIDFACPNKGESLTYGLELWNKKANSRGCACDYGFHMTIDDWNPDIISELPKMIESGVSSFKIYMTYPAMMIGDKALSEALKELKKIGAIAGVHCENSAAIDRLISEKIMNGETGPSSHPASRPAVCEAEAISRLLKFAKLADSPVIIVHLSSEEGMNAVRSARKNGQTVYVETCPQYLLLNDSNYGKEKLEAAKFVCAPPLRKESDLFALWSALKNGEIQTVSTDHCSFTVNQKAVGLDDFRNIPGGLPGVESRGILLFSEGVQKGRISLKDMCRVLCENPARLYGLYPQKGVISPGSDADIVLIDPNRKTVLTAESLHSAAGYTPFEGWQLDGSVSDVFLRGKLVYHEGTVLDRNSGKRLFRQKYSAPI